MSDLVSIVVPVYFNEQNLADTIPRLLELQSSCAECRLELVFVDDGSGDRSLDVLHQWQQRHPDVITVVSLTRNFGSMAAIQAGLSVAAGECVGMIAADLQDPPELFIEMLKRWRQGAKAIFAVRRDREDSLFQRLFSNWYYALIRRFALPDYPRGGFDFFLIDREVVRHVNRIAEKNTNLMSLIFWLGYRPVSLEYTRRRREKGESRWTLAKKIKLFIDSFVAFSYVPIRALSTGGLLVAISAFAYAIYIVGAWALRGIPVKGYAPIVILIALTAGVQMMMLGVLGEYLWRVLDETRRRPPFVIDRIRSARHDHVEEVSDSGGRGAYGSGTGTPPRRDRDHLPEFGTRSAREISFGPDQ